MKKVTLTSIEFLSIYTGILFGENFLVVLKGLEKYFGDPVTTVDSIRGAKIFRQHINKTRPDLVSVMNLLGNYTRDKRFDYETQANDYLAGFEELYGKNVEIEQFSNEEFYRLFPANDFNM